MALTKQPVNINFNQGIDTKTDPKQVQLGKFLALNNMVFDKAGGLIKRTGFSNITDLPNLQQTTLTTQSGNLIATGSNLYAYSADTDQWLNRGTVQPIGIDVQPLVRVSTSQSAQDTAIAPNGLVCLVYLDNGISYYQVSDSVTGQQIISRTALPLNAVVPRVTLFNRYFMITFGTVIAATRRIQFIAVPYNTPDTPSVATDITTAVSINYTYDVSATDSNLYLSNTTDVTTIATRAIGTNLIVSAPVSVVGKEADIISVAICRMSNVIWTTFYDDAIEETWVIAYTSNLQPHTALTQITSALSIANITSVAQNGLLSVIFQRVNTYSFSAVRSDFLQTVIVTATTAAVSAITTILRSTAIASKAFIDTDSGTIYVIAVYGGTNQPTYFIIDLSGNIYARIAPSNGSAYNVVDTLPSVSFQDGVFYSAYLIKNFLASVNKGTDVATGLPVNAIYTQVGINLVKFTINTSGQYSSEIANTLHLTGGMVWQYDGVRPVEQGFHVYPEDNTVTTVAVGGLITAQKYYYVFTYEWTDNQGNLHRSAPSIPVGITTTGAVTTNTLRVPTLRLTYKVSPNPVRIVGYRWSVAQQQYYQFTSLTSPTANDTTVDSVTFTDTLADSSILGNVLLYTTGGVIENIAPPAAAASTLYKNRFFIINAEERNVLSYSKQVIQNTPVEMSDLLTIYVAPTTGAQGSTGQCTALTTLDDKLVIFKENAIYYLTGNGPDNTGANNDFSDPVFITAAVGCINPNSIVVMPQGVMFQSNKGIWLLDRSLNTQYIGAAVEKYNNYTVYGASAIHGTNQVRFVLNDNVTLMYDFYYGQWGTHSNIKAISSVIYNAKDTYLSSLGQVYQETSGFYLDGSTPVLMSFTTSWVSLAGIQGLERFYSMYIEGTYFSPFKLNIELAYDYNSSPLQNVLVSPDNYTPTYGTEGLYGSTDTYSKSNVFEARVFPAVQKCETFQITCTEVFDPSFNTTANQGLNLSAITLIIGTKRGYRTQPAKQSFG